MDALTTLVPAIPAAVWWVLAAIAVLVGLAGTVLPVLPGVVLVWVGLFVGAWIDGFVRVSVGAMAWITVLAVLAFATDYVAAMLGAKRVGASRWALIGAAAGTIVGLLMGFVGVLFMPFVGAVVGELYALRRAPPALPPVDVRDAAAPAGSAAGSAGAGVGSAPRSADASHTQRALRVGTATWVGLLVGTAVKLALVFMMIGIFLVALWWR